MIDGKKTRRKIEDFLRKNATEDQIIEVAKTLGVEVAHLSSLKKVRPGQVKCAMQLRKGLKYQYVNEDDGLMSEFTVLSDPFLAGDDMKILVTFHRPWGDSEGEISLKENNIFPKNDEAWFPKNWIAFTKESKVFDLCLCPKE